MPETGPSLAKWKSQRKQCQPTMTKMQRQIVDRQGLQLNLATWQSHGWLSPAFLAALLAQCALFSVYRLEIWAPEACWNSRTRWQSTCSSAGGSLVILGPLDVFFFWILRLGAVVGRCSIPSGCILLACLACHGVVIVARSNPEAEKLWLLCLEAFSWWPPTYHKAGC